jgi:hypothetical protein
MFKINDTVKVKSGIKDPDNEQFDLSDWQGRIINIEKNTDDPLVTIEWDNVTLMNMPAEFIEDSEENGYGFSEMNLLASEVELTFAREIEHNRGEIIASLEQNSSWAGFGEQGKRIKIVVNDCKNNFAIMQHWFEHLDKNLDIPVKVKYTGDSNQNLRYGSELVINRLKDADDTYGVIGSGKCQGRQVQVPLCDVEVLEFSEKTQILEDYVVWFANQ